MTRLWDEVHFMPPIPAEIVPAQKADKEQEEIIACSRWPCETRAGPGAGKSNTIVRKVARLVNYSDDLAADSFRIAILTFTNAGKAVLRARIGAAGIPKERVQVLGTQEVSWRAYRKAHPGKKKILPGQQRELLKLALQKCNRKVPADLEAILREALQYINEMRELPPRISGIARQDVLESYQVEKQGVNMYDDGDVRQWICDNAEVIADEVLAEGLKVVLLDEAQDSSPAEAALLKALHEKSIKVGDVGDLRQVLYEFRGAQPRLLSEAFGSTEGYHVHALRVNRRSRAMPVGELNRFAARFFDGIEAEEMFSLVPGGEPFRAVVCPEPSAVLEVLPKALAAVGGLVRQTGGRVPRADPRLAHALGLPRDLENGQSLLIEVANRTDAKQIERVLRGWGYEPVMLVRHDDAPGLLELLYGLCDPEGKTGGPTVWYGQASPLCLVLHALRNRPDLKMKKESQGSQEIDRVITIIREKEQDMGFDDLLQFLLHTLGGKQERVGSRLINFLQEAVELNKRWKEIRDAEYAGTLEPRLVLSRLLDLVGYIRKEDRTEEGGFPIQQYLVESCGTRVRAAQQLRAWLEGPALGRSGFERARDRRAPAMVYIAVVNQVKGDEADYVLIVALDAGRFPYKGEDTPGERCRWWVAISRARYGTAYLGVEGNSLYWPSEEPRVI